MNDTDRAAIERVAQTLTEAWMARDGTAFARAFAEDADFVTIFATHQIGRDAIAKQHQAIFDGIYRDSHITFSVKQARVLAPGVVLAHIGATLDVPQGPMAGGMHTLATAILVGGEAGWTITAFQNTREQALPRPPRD